MYHAIVIEESLTDKEALNKYKVLGIKRSPRWRMRVVEVPDLREFILDIQDAMVITPSYYFHIYNGEELIVAFRDIYYDMDPKDKKTWVEAQEYGAERLGIPAEELDFSPNDFESEEEWLDEDD